MRLGIINSAFAQAGVNTVDGLRHIARIGFDCVDIFTEAYTIAATQIKQTLEISKTLDLPIVSLPVVAAGLIDFNDPVRAFHVARVKKFIDLAKTWRAENIVLVLGEYIWQREVIPPEQQWEWAVETCRELGDYAAAREIVVAMELEPFRLSLLNSIDKMAQFLKHTNHPRVKANLDISHLVLADVGPEQIDKLKGQVVHVHISDCNGSVHGDLPPGRGIVKFSPYLRAIKKLHFEGVISIELEYSPEPDKIVEWVEEAYRMTDQLMKQAGLRTV